MNYMLITNQPDIAFIAEKSGVNRIFIDLERIGKQERQGHLDTFISQHCFSDIVEVKRAVSRIPVLVRLNPLYDGSAEEIEKAITNGADFLMLPMIKEVGEIETFSELVANRAGVIPLIETYEATQNLSEIVEVQGITEIYIGLNDLHLDMGLEFMFEPLANGYLDTLISIIKDAGLPFGFGGIARVGEGIIPGEMVLAEHKRLGSTSVILSRTFHRRSETCTQFNTNVDLKKEIDKLNAFEVQLSNRTDENVFLDKEKLGAMVFNFIKEKNEKNI